MPTNDTDYMQEYMRNYRADGRDGSTRTGRSNQRKFVGVDGEGRTLDNGYHAYFMLRAGDKLLCASENMARLTTIEILEFLSSLSPENIYVGYFFDYDTTKTLEDLSFAKLAKLIRRELRVGYKGMLFPIDYANFQVDYLPHKEFKVRKLIRETEAGKVWSPWIVINDVGSFFQTSFLKAIKAWNIGTPEEWEMIRVGKENRAAFEIEDFADIDKYNALEIKLLEELMTKFREACRKAGYIPAKWQGPGVLAEAMLRKHRVPKSRDIELLKDIDLVSMGINAYYGGRSEVAMIGPINVPCYQADINSAYPYAMQYVPCLIHGKWERVNDSEDLRNRVFTIPRGRRNESFALLYGSFSRADAANRTLWYGLPVRASNGTIIYPEQGSGWYWSFEISSAIHQSFVPEYGYVYTRTCGCSPLAFVREIYATRQAIGKDGPGIVLKLGMNSLYGKTVQSIGFPKYANPIWGSFITAFPRMQINDFIHSSPMCKAGKCGHDIVMVATDSVTTTTNRVDVIESKELGGWSFENHPGGLFVVQPGVYFGTSGKAPKTRGVPLSNVEPYEDVFRDAFDTMMETGVIGDGNVSVPVKAFCGIKYALHRKDMKLLGQWIEYGEEDARGKVISFDWSGKRSLGAVLEPTATRSWLQTFPYEGAPAIQTVPYDKNIGGLLLREEARILFEDQPDWGGIEHDLLG